MPGDCFEDFVKLPSRSIGTQVRRVNWRGSQENKTGVTGEQNRRTEKGELSFSKSEFPACDSTQPAWLTTKGAARHLGISPAYAGLLLKRGIIPGMQVVQGSIWWVDPVVLDSKDLRETLRALGLFA